LEVRPPPGRLARRPTVRPSGVPAERQAVACHEHQADERDRQERDRVQHDGGADRALVRDTVEHGGAHAERVVEAADRTGRRDGHADREERDDQERAREGDRNMECPRDEPDARGDRQPQRQREHQGPADQRWPPHDGEALGEGAHRVDQGPADARGQRPRQASRQCAESLRMARQHGEHDQHRDGDDDGDHATRAHGREQRRVGLECRGVGDEHERAEQQDDGHEVEEPLDDDRCEGRRRLQPFAAGQQVRTEELPRTGRQERVGGEPDDRRAKGHGQVGLAHGLEQHLPAQRTKEVGRALEENRQHQQFRPRVADFSPNLGEVRVPQEQNQQTGSAGEDREGPQMGAHRGRQLAATRPQRRLVAGGIRGGSTYYTVAARVYGQA
jgi:hypothetical protein